jgi:hypothetical protein
MVASGEKDNPVIPVRAFRSVVLADSLTTATLVVAGVTLVLAVVTAISVWVAIKGFRLSAREIEEGRRPLVMPLDSSTGGSGPHAGAHGHLIPVENIGTGPALGLVAEISGSTVDGTKKSKPCGGLAVSAHTKIEIDATPNETIKYVLLLTYTDVAGKRLTTTAKYSGSLFEEVTLGPTT